MRIIEAIVCMNETGIVGDMEGKVDRLEGKGMNTMIDIIEEVVAEEDHLRNVEVATKDVDMNMTVAGRTVIETGIAIVVEIETAIETGTVIIVIETVMTGVVIDQEVIVVVHGDTIDTVAEETVLGVDLLGGEITIHMTVIIKGGAVSDLHHYQVQWIRRGKMTMPERMAAMVNNSNVKTNLECIIIHTTIIVKLITKTMWMLLLLHCQLVILRLPRGNVFGKVLNMNLLVKIPVIEKEAIREIRREHRMVVEDMMKIVVLVVVAVPVEEGAGVRRVDPWKAVEDAIEIMIT